MTSSSVTDPARHPSRRWILAGLAAGSALGFALPARALTEARAQSLVQEVVDEIKRVINSGRSEAQMIGEFERLFERYADVPTIARYSLGADARSASSAQLSAFTDAFSGYIARKYGRRFREFIGGDIRVRGTRADNNYVVVSSVALLRGQEPFAVDFLISDRSGRDLFFNVIIEGINMLTTERTEIGALLDRNGGSIDRLTQSLRAAA